MTHETKKRISRIWQTLTPIVTIIVIVFLLQTGCGLSANSQKGISPFPDPTGILPGGGGETSPIDEKNKLPPKGPEEDCPAQGSGPVAANLSEIDFGLNQIKIDPRECITVSLNTCQPASAEITGQNTPQEEDPEFVLVSSGTEGTKKIALSNGSVDVCYNRYKVTTNEGLTAYLKIVADDGSFSIPNIRIKGRALPEIFNISSPKPYLLVWEKPFGPAQQSDTSKPYVSYFDITASGQANVANYASLVTKKEIIIRVTPHGDTQPVALGKDGSFSQIIAIPATPRVYSVDFTIKIDKGSNKGSITRSIPVIRYGAPSGTLEVRDQSGNLVSSIKKEDIKSPTTTTDAFAVGAIIDNLPASAPAVYDPSDVSSGPLDSHPLRIYFKIHRFNNTQFPYLVYRKKADPKDLPWLETNNEKEAPDAISFYEGFFSVKDNETLKCPSANKFTQRDITYCIPDLKPSLFGKGINEVRATVCNDFTDFGSNSCTELKTNIIVDNDLPKITLDSVTDGKNALDDGAKFNQKDQIIIRGTVENYKNDVEERDGRCVKSSVGLWVNMPYKVNDTVGGMDPVPVCPKVVPGKGAKNNLDSGNTGNIKMGTFCLVLDRDANAKVPKDCTSLDATVTKRLTLYTNLVHMMAENNSGHRKLLTASFQRGEYKPSKPDNRNGKKNIMTSDLGTGPAGDIQYAPLMLFISKGTLDGTDRNKNPSGFNLKLAIEKALNENLHFEDLIQNYAPNEYGRIPSDITADSHMSGIGRVMKWIENGQKNFAASETDNSCGFHTDGTCAAILFPRNLNDPRLFGNPKLGKELKDQDFWSPVVFGMRNEQGQLLDINDKPIDTLAGGWPVNDSDISRIKPNYDFNDIYQGKITADKITTSKTGDISAELTIHGFMGHAFAFSMCAKGALDYPPVIPIIFNIKQLHLRLDKARIERVAVGNDGKPLPGYPACTGNACTNMLVIPRESLKLDGPELAQSIQMEASDKCMQEVGQCTGPVNECENKQIGVNGDNDDPVYNNYRPYGCVPNRPGSNWILLEQRNKMEYLTNIGTKLLNILQEVLRQTFRDMLWCDIPNTMVNPMINPKAFEYPTWYPTDSRVEDLTIAVEKPPEGDATIKLLKKESEGKDVVFALKPNLKDAVIDVSDKGLMLRASAAIGASDIIGNPDGFMVRDRENDLIKTLLSNFWADYPRHAITETPYLGLSANLEEVLNGGLHVLLKKSLKDLLDLAGIDKMETQSGYPMGPMSTGVDQVILGRFDLCGSIAGFLKTELSATFLFSRIVTLFTAEGRPTHLDLTINSKNPPTLFLDRPREDEEGDAVIQLGLSNVQLSAHDLFPRGNNKFDIGKEEIVRIRLDGILRLPIKVTGKGQQGEDGKPVEQTQIDIFVPPLNKQVVYLSVIERGPVFDEPLIVANFYDPLLFTTLNFLSVNGGSAPSFSVALPNYMSEFNEFQCVKPGVDEKNNKTYAGCGSSTAPKPDKIARFKQMILMQDFTSMPKNGECEDGKEPEYYVEPPMQNFGDHAMADLGRALRATNISTSLTMSDWRRKELFGISDYIDPCEDVAGNSLMEDLCENLGITEIGLDRGPVVEIDPVNGYLHISTGLTVETYKELEAEVTPLPGE